MRGFHRLRSNQGTATVYKDIFCCFFFLSLQQISQVCIIVPVSMAEISDWEMSVFQVFNHSPCDPRQGSLCARTDVFATFMMDKIICVEGGLRLQLSLVGKVSRAEQDTDFLLR